MNTQAPQAETLPSIPQMALRVKVAELCGYTACPTGDGCWIDPVHQYHHTVRGTGGTRPLPDYPNDLNACAELTDLLADKGWRCRLDNGLDKTWECTFSREAGECPLCERGFPRNDEYGQHYGTQRLGMIPNTLCMKRREEHYRGAATLSLAIITAFIATMEASKTHEKEP